MSEALPTFKRPQTLGEEIANSVSHGLGLVLALAALPILIVDAARRGEALNVAGVGVYAVTLVLVYLASTVYHALPQNKLKRLFRVLDQAAIFLLIAGTYTPFTLGVMRGGWGWTLFGLVWGLAIVGVVLKAVGGAGYPRLTMSLYLVMGWLALIAVKPVWLRVELSGIAWILAGGVAYTLGVACFVVDERIRYSHFVWHLFVLVGSACHFFAVLWYSA